jgi:hypothetical protein
LYMHLISILAILLICSSGIVRGDDINVDPEISVPLFLKIITYDYNFNKEIFISVDVYSLYDKSIEESYEEFLSVDHYFQKHRDLTIDGLPVNFHPIEYDNLNSLFSLDTITTYNLVLITSIGENRIDHILNSLSGKRIRSFAFEPDYVPMGIAVSTKIKNSKPSIFINLKTSRNEGCNFSTHLLKMCEIYEE